ncbi:EAL domain-containing protein [Methylobrevis pamukkalensis]|uniref:Phytochrome-like protein cph2 n=1 Tax=Methylobrevis pamukkalensis TaxID=1439726 RepID=A0A1E3H4E6_9HYPH|nr:EAL domain-containing protein [Methylobrevis pamukkalensis]ODN70391.1 Phytochrome-like protein cph2 [Methylobrevis pamukkalensis]
MNLPKVVIDAGEDASGTLVTRLSGIRHAFQPIVDIHTGVVHAYEALLRGTMEGGYPTIASFFDAAYIRHELAEVELILASRAIETLGRLPGGGARRLFLNIDGRTLEDQSFRVDRLLKLAADNDLNPGALCIELSEQHKTAHSSSATMMVAALRAGQIRIALDDFGQGFSELTLLYAFQPEYVKIDRFFVADIARSPRKKLFVSTVVNLAHVLGAKVIAEGIETAEEHTACREIGCDLAQGYYIARPCLEVEQMPGAYRHVMTASSFDRRKRESDETIVRAEVNPVPPVDVDLGMKDVFDRFRRAPDQAYFPVLGHGGEPIGLLHERNLRSFVFSPTGRDILQNSFFAHKLFTFVTRCPIADISRRWRRFSRCMPTVARPRR